MNQHKGLKIRMLAAGSILFAFYAALVGLAISIWGTGIWPIAIALTALFGVFQYVLGKKMALWSVGAEDLDENDYYQIHAAVERMSRDMGIEKPRVMKAQMGVPNAFAVGRKGAGVVVISEELMRLLDQEELEGVIAHELAHIRNRDVIMMVVGQSIASMIGIAVYFLTVMGNRNIGAMITGWILSSIAQMIVMIFVLAISRYREYVADADAAEVVGRGEPLARALEKISNAGQGAKVDDRVNALCIFGGGERSLTQKIFSTHPPTEERISRLRSY
ncbi:MAG: M48 family metalloprotease [Halobacteriales archaeon]|nr:M48 family metalloprotease [Halobacteriales archaeon]